MGWVGFDWLGLISMYHRCFKIADVLCYIDLFFTCKICICAIFGVFLSYSCSKYFRLKYATHLDSGCFLVSMKMNFLNFDPGWYRLMAHQRKVVDWRGKESNKYWFEEVQFIREFGPKLIEMKK